MDAQQEKAQQEVEKELDKVKASASKVEEQLERARDAWIEDARLKEVVEHLQAAQEKLAAQRKDLEAKLPGMGQAGGSGGTWQTGDVSVQLGMLLPPPPDVWPQNAAAVRDYLNDHHGMRIPVTAAHDFIKPSALNRDSLCIVLPSELAAGFTAYITSPPVERHSEVTSLCVVNDAYKATFGQFERLDPVPCSPNFFGNRSATKGSTGSILVHKRKRPDSILTINELTLFLGEDKLATEMHAALEDIKSKLQDVNMDFYGGTPFLVAYTAAGTNIQFHSIFFQGATPRLEVATDELNLAHAKNRVYVVLVMAKLYVLLRHMAAQRRGPHALFSKRLRAEDTTITFLPNSVEKKIRRCAEYFARFSTTQAAVEKAYAAATKEAEAAKIAGRRATLITAAAPPAVTYGTWHVQLQPLLYECAVPCTEQDLLDIAFALCTAADALHSGGVVHRDFRLQNVMQHKNGRDKVVIDLELAAAAGRLVEGMEPLCDWDDKTLEEGRYTRKSDMYQIGRLLELNSGRVALSVQAQEFVRALKARELTAADALAHPWLSSRQKPEAA